MSFLLMIFLVDLVTQRKQAFLPVYRYYSKMKNKLCLSIWCFIIIFSKLIKID